MKNILTIILFVTLFKCSKAQIVDFYGKKINVSGVCNSLGFSDDKDAKNYLNQVCSAAGIRSNFIMVQCNSIGTCLAIEKDGDPYILYDNIFLSNLKSSINYGFTEKKIIQSNKDVKDWSSMTILAHEIGHHVNQHFSKTIRSAYSVKELELQADEYAGHILYSLGASLQQGEKVFYSSFVPINGSLEHPARVERIKSFEDGFNKEKLRFGGTRNDNTSKNNYSELILGNWIDDKGVVFTFFNNASFKLSQNQSIKEGEWSLTNDVLNIKIDDAPSWNKINVVGINNYSLSLKANENDITILKRTNLSAENSATEYLIKNWSKFIYIDKFSITTRQLGGIWDVNVPFVNNSDYVIDLIRVKVDYVKDKAFASGDIYKTEYIDFTDVQPHSRQVIQAPNSDRGTSVRTSIVILHSSVMHIN